MTTPNSDLVYAMSYLDLAKYGPLVVEAPPGVQGMFDDFFQRPIVEPTIDGKTWRGDVGLAGPDKGKGGTYVLLPPGYDGPEPTEASSTARAPTMCSCSGAPSSGTRRT